MKRTKYFSLLIPVLTILILSVLLFAEEKEFGVYEYVVQSIQGEFTEVSQAIENGLQQAGWQVLAKVDAGVPEGCKYRAQVFVVYDSQYSRQIMEANSNTGPFAVVDRVTLFEDENGLHVSVVNPHSINRTVLMDDMAYEDLAEKHLQALRTAITGVVHGTVTDQEYGQKRGKGYIGRTMGIMAGGKFEDKIQDDAVVEGGNLQSVAEGVREGLSRTGEKWGMHLVYELELPEYQTVLFGTTGGPMEAKSFDIVKAGSDKSRQDMSCPGLAYAAAYPIEIVVVKEADAVKVRMLDVMYRMKMYFEDAGKWAFMKNMGMPGSIHDELKGQIKIALNLN